MREKPFDPIICVPPDQIDAAWPLVEGKLRAAYEECDELMPSNLKEWLRKERGLLWIYTTDGQIHGVVITSLELRPSGKVLRLGAGDYNLKLFAEVTPRIVEYARAEGCRSIVLEGRPGLSRALAGFKTVRVQLEKVL